MSQVTPKIAFLTNTCTHYRVGTYERLAQRYDVDFYFYSAGREWYWQQAHGAHAGHFRSIQLAGVDVGGNRFVPDLPLRLLKGRYDAFLGSINGRFVLPITYMIARLLRKPFVLWTGVWMRLDTRLHRAVFPLVRYIYTHADAVVVYGEHVQRYLVSEGVAADRIFIAGNAVDNSLYDQTVAPEKLRALRETLKIAEGERVVLYLGRIEDGKGLEYLLDAFAASSPADAVLVIAGAGSLLEELRARAQRLGIDDRVRFPGYVPVAQAVEYYALASVYVLPSVTTRVFKEPWGLVVNEAFCQGVTVIATDAVGAAMGGLLRDGEQGLVVPERNAPALASALTQLLADEPLRRRMSAAARAAVAVWNQDRMADGFAQAFAFAAVRR